MMRFLGVALTILLAAACAPQNPGPICQQPPAGLKAQAFVSGSKDSVALTVDKDTGETQGEFSLNTESNHQVAVEWYLEREFQGSPVRVLFAQYRSELKVDELSLLNNQIDLNWDGDEIIVSNCRHYALNAKGELIDTNLKGEKLIDFNGELRAVCDLDSSCGKDNIIDSSCNNFGEICRGQDPLSQDDGDAGN